VGLDESLGEEILAEETEDIASVCGSSVETGHSLRLTS